jgi:MOSC domain-containing protein YiiM
VKGTALFSFGEGKLGAMDTLFDLGHLTTVQIEAGIAEVLDSPKNEGTLRMIVRRPKVNAREVIEAGTLDAEQGLIGDNWLKKGSRWRRGGDPKRQITVMNWRFAKLVAGDEERVPLAGDQLYVDLDLSQENLPLGTRITVGKAVIEVTKPPHLGCKKFVERFGMDAMMFANSDFGKTHNLRGINARVINGGEVRAGDRVSKIEEPV